MCRFRGLRGVAFVLLLLSVAGCDTMYPAAAGDERTELAHFNRWYADDVMSRYESLNGDDRAQRQYRNDFIRGRMAVIDIHFRAFERETIQGHAALNLANDLAAIGLGASGTLVPAASTKAVLAAVSGGLAGAKGSIDKQLFYDRTLPALFSKMRSLRAAQRAYIESRLAQPVASYTLADAFRDTGDYYFYGSIPGALADIEGQSGMIAAGRATKINNTFVLATVETNDAALRGELDALLARPLKRAATTAATPTSHERANQIAGEILPGATWLQIRALGGDALRALVDRLARDVE